MIPFFYSAGTSPTMSKWHHFLLESDVKMALLTKFRWQTGVEWKKKSVVLRFISASPLRALNKVFVLSSTTAKFRSGMTLLQHALAALPSTNLSADAPALVWTIRWQACCARRREEVCSPYQRTDHRSRFLKLRRNARRKLKVKKTLLCLTKIFYALTQLPSEKWLKFRCRFDVDEMR